MTKSDMISAILSAVDDMERWRTRTSDGFVVYLKDWHEFDLILRRLSGIAIMEGVKCHAADNPRKGVSRAG